MMLLSRISSLSELSAVVFSLMSWSFASRQNSSLTFHTLSRSAVAVEEWRLGTLRCCSEDIDSRVVTLPGSAVDCSYAVLALTVSVCDKSVCLGIGCSFFFVTPHRPEHLQDHPRYLLAPSLPAPHLLHPALLRVPPGWRSAELADSLFSRLPPPASGPLGTLRRIGSHG